LAKLKEYVKISISALDHKNSKKSFMEVLRSDIFNWGRAERRLNKYSTHLRSLTKSLKEVGGATNLAELANKVPTAAHVEHYAKIVKDHSIKRSLMSAAAKMFDLAMDEGLPTVELLDKAESEVFNLTQNSLSKSFTHIKSTLSDSFDRLDELHKTGGGVRGVSTGYKDIDNGPYQKSYEDHLWINELTHCVDSPCSVVYCFQA